MFHKSSKWMDTGYASVPPPFCLIRCRFFRLLLCASPHSVVMVMVSRSNHGQYKLFVSSSKASKHTKVSLWGEITSLNNPILLRRCTNPTRILRFRVDGIWCIVGRWYMVCGWYTVRRTTYSPLPWRYYQCMAGHQWPSPHAEHLIAPATHASLGSWSWWRGWALRSCDWSALPPSTRRRCDGRCDAMTDPANRSLDRCAHTTLTTQTIHTSQLFTFTTKTIPFQKFISQSILCVKIADKL